MEWKNLGGRLATTTLLALTAACADAPEPTAPPTSLGTAAAVGGTGHVYTSTNQVTGNAVLMYRRAADGTLTFGASYPTGGTGTGGGLGNQGAVILSYDGRFLLTVNAGSDDISVFRRRADGSLTLTDRIASGGDQPVSLAAWGGRTYVLNAGGDGNVSAFFLLGNGDIRRFRNGTRPLSQAGGTAPAQVGLLPGGQTVVVTEKATNRIVTYDIGPGGVAGPPVVHPSQGATPFGFGIRGDDIIVSEAQGGAPGASTVSSYDLGPGGAFSVVSSSVPDFQSAVCWIVVTDDGRFAFGTNTGSNNISGYSIASDGALTLLGGGVSATSDAGPIDAALSRGSKFLYVLNAGGHTITGYAVGADGSLTPVGSVGGLPVGTNGLAAR